MQYYLVPCALQRHVHAICSLIDSSGYAYGPIRRRLFIDYILNSIMDLNEVGLMIYLPKKVIIHQSRGEYHFLG